MDIGWVGLGRMGRPMAERLLRAGYPVRLWNRTPEKANALRSQGGTVVERIEDLRSADVVLTMLSTGKDVEEVCFGAAGIAAENAPRPRIIVDCSTIGVDESAALRRRLAVRGVEYIAAPVSGNPLCVAAGKLCCVVSGSKDAFGRVADIIRAFAPAGVSYAGEGETARMCKIAHNVFMSVVIENLCEVTILAQKAGVPRHVFLEFINNSVMGSIFTRYKSNALVNLDFTTTFTIGGLRKDLDLGLRAAQQVEAAMPIAAATREMFQSHINLSTTHADAGAYLKRDFAALVETVALCSGIRLTSEQVPMATGLEGNSL